MKDPLRAIKKEADDIAKKLADGAFGDFTQAKSLVERRKGLLQAMEIFEQSMKGDDEDE